MSQSEHRLPAITDMGAYILSTSDNWAVAHPKGGEHILPEGMVVAGDLDCDVYAGLRSLPHSMSVLGAVYLDKLDINGPSVWLHIDLPETVQVQIVGRRFGEVVSHRLLNGHPIEDATIVSAVAAGVDHGGTILTLDEDPFPWPGGRHHEYEPDYDDIPF